MADVTCPLTFEDWHTLLSHKTLPPTLRTILEDPARTVELDHGYEIDWPEAEARSLLAHARGRPLPFGLLLFAITIGIVSWPRSITET
jgi:hypothetical protein